MTTQFACVEVEEHDGLLVNEARGETGCDAMGDGWDIMVMLGRADWWSCGLWIFFVMRAASRWFVGEEDIATDRNSNTSDLFLLLLQLQSSIAGEHAPQSQAPTSSCNKAHFF